MYDTRRRFNWRRGGLVVVIVLSVACALLVGGAVIQTMAPGVALFMAMGDAVMGLGLIVAVLSPVAFVAVGVHTSTLPRYPRM